MSFTVCWAYSVTSLLSKISRPNPDSFDAGDYFSYTWSYGNQGIEKHEYLDGKNVTEWDVCTIVWAVWAVWLCDIGADIHQTAPRAGDACLDSNIVDLFRLKMRAIILNRGELGLVHCTSKVVNCYKSCVNHWYCNYLSKYLTEVKMLRQWFCLSYMST